MFFLCVWKDSFLFTCRWLALQNSNFKIIVAKRETAHYTCRLKQHYKSYNPNPNKPWFLRVCSISLLKTLWEKEKLLVTSNFSFSHSVFYPFWRTLCHSHQTKICRLQTLSVWKGVKFVVWERVNSASQIYKVMLHIALSSNKFLDCNYIPKFTIISLWYNNLVLVKIKVCCRW